MVSIVKEISMSTDDEKLDEVIERIDNAPLNRKPGHPEVVTLSGNPRDPNYQGGDPRDIDPSTGMHQDYWVLSKEERAKGFVKPVRKSYIHTGARPKYSLVDLTDEQKELYKDVGYVKFEKYPEGSTATGRFWTQEKLSSGCGNLTSMGTALAETYARDPHFYGSTYCCTCMKHFPLDEFKWINNDGSLGEVMDPNA